MEQDDDYGMVLCLGIIATFALGALLIAVLMTLRP